MRRCEWMALVLAGVLLAGCGPKADKAFVARMAEAEQARSDVDKAVAIYDDAARRASRAADAMLAREAAATLLERSARTNLGSRRDRR